MHAYRNKSVILPTALLCVVAFGSLAVLSDFQYLGTKIACWREDTSACTRLGSIYFSPAAYNLDKAEFYFRKADALNPNATGILYYLGRIEFIRGDLNTSIFYMDRAIKIDADFEQAYYMRGLAEGYAGYFPQAIRDFQTYTSMAPDQWAGWNDLSFVYFKAGKFKEAEDTARAGLEIFPDNPWLNNALGVALLNQQKFQDAEAYLQAALARFEQLTLTEWGSAYPGNNPISYESGLLEAVESVKVNLTLLESTTAN